MLIILYLAAVVLVMVGQFVAKVGGGFVWSLLLNWHASRQDGDDA